jgi:hypothetical protein
MDSASGRDVAGGRFIVKEFRYHDGERPACVAAAAEFEYSLWHAGSILMPEPVRARDRQLAGSVYRPASARKLRTGSTVATRVHPVTLVLRRTEEDLWRAGSCT